MSPAYYATQINDEFIPSYLKDTFIIKYNKAVPTRWNKLDSSDRLEVFGENDLVVRYIGPGQSNFDAAAIRANCSIPIEVGLYYFEVSIIDAGKNGSISIGFGVRNALLGRLPGWEPNTFGFHGDDGKKFRSNLGKKYGPSFTTGDTIGCGINFFTNTAFYTKNGINLGNAFKDLTIVRTFYPMIGLLTRGECIEANFGHKPFIFNINDYARKFFRKK